MDHVQSDLLPETLITTYLEMTGASQFVPAYVDLAESTHIARIGIVDVEYYRFLYASVGYAWRWRDRLEMPVAELSAILERPETEIDVLYGSGVPAGYVELDRQGTDVEIAYFGLRAGFIGQGYGKHLLSHGITRAWEGDTQRVWVHTCNLDGPHALRNYERRGFSVYKVDEQPMPERYR